MATRAAACSCRQLRLEASGDPIRISMCHCLPANVEPEVLSQSRRGHGLHLHFAVGRYVKQSLIRDVWGRGHVHIKLLDDLPVGSGSLEEARLSARYLSKYAGKNVGEQKVAGLHRYEVA